MAVAKELVSGVLCFFFQAEDGIRDVAVTGVQTCALPISWHHRRKLNRRRAREIIAMQPSGWEHRGISGTSCDRQRFGRALHAGVGVPRKWTDRKSVV